MANSNSTRCSRHCQRLAEMDGNSKATQTLSLQSQELVRELGGN